MACDGNNAAILELLMKHGCDPNVIPDDENKLTSMIKAGFKGNLSLIKTLINADGKYKSSFNWVCIIV